MKKVSIKDIARIAGVAQSTVSFVLNGKAREMRISVNLAEKVLAVAEEHGYHPNQLAVSLRTGKSKILGLVVESISGHFFGSLAKVIEEEAEHFGYRVVYCSTDNNSKKGHELIRMLSMRHVDGYLITPTKGMENDIFNLIAHNKPVVLIDSYFPDLPVPHVVVDNEGGVRTGIEHLIKKGYKRIAFITVDLEQIQIRLRETAYWNTLKEFKIKVDEKLVLKLSYNYKPEEALKEISSFIQAIPGIDAVFFSTYYLGITGLEAIKNLGLSIPSDIAVVCFDDHDLFRLYPPGITIIQQPIEQLAKKAIELLMLQMQGKTTPLKKKQLALAANFVERGST
jgi:LacI family transcriptional regulator